MVIKVITVLQGIHTTHISIYFAFTITNQSKSYIIINSFGDQAWDTMKNTEENQALIRSQGEQRAR